MTEKRYYQRDFEELYYIIDSTVISEEEFDERVEYEGYSAFEDSLTGEEIVELLNENEELKYSLAAHMVDLNNCKGECSVLELENEKLKSDFLNNKRFAPYEKEIERLKIQNKDLLTANATIRKENEQLKSDLKTLQLQDEDRKLYQRELEKENEELKKELNCFEPVLFNDLIGKPVTLYKKEDV